LVEINLLPRSLRRRAETNWWRVAAVGVPVTVLGAIAILQYGAITENNRLTAERDQLKLEVDTLRPYVRDQRTLIAQRAELEKISSVDKAIRSDARPWSTDIAGFVETLTASGARVSLTQLQATHVAGAAPGSAPTPDNGYDGKNVTSELSVTGDAASVADVIRLVRAFETSPNYGIQLGGFQARTNADETDRTYTFNARVGIVTPVPAAAPATASESTTAPAGTPGEGGEDSGR
jgi:type IV pilus assembly protein PilN